MNRLIEDLLELSRIGRQANTPEAVPMTELASEVCETLAGEIAERGAEVVIAPNLPLVRGDRTRLSQLLQNLLQNALQYMGDQAKPRIEVAARPGDAGESVYYISDNGIGIAAEYHDKDLPSSSSASTSTPRAPASAWPWSSASSRCTAAGSGSNLPARSAAQRSFSRCRRLMIRRRTLAAEPNERSAEQNPVGWALAPPRRPKAGSARQGQPNDRKNGESRLVMPNP